MEFTPPMTVISQNLDPQSKVDTGCLFVYSGGKNIFWGLYYQSHQYGEGILFAQMSFNGKFKARIPAYIIIRLKPKAL